MGGQRRMCWTESTGSQAAERKNRGNTKHPSLSQNTSQNTRIEKIVKFPNCPISHPILSLTADLPIASRVLPVTRSTFIYRLFPLIESPFLGWTETKETTHYFWPSFSLLRKLIFREVQCLARILSWQVKALDSECCSSHNSHILSLQFHRSTLVLPSRETQARLSPPPDTKPSDIEYPYSFLSLYFFLAKHCFIFLKFISLTVKWGNNISHTFWQEYWWI